MATPTQVPEPPLAVYRFTVAEYHRLRDAGVLSDPEGLEFIAGLLVPKMSRNPIHDAVLDRLEDLIRDLLPAGWRLRGQKAIALTDGEPEPDVAVVPGPAGRYKDHHPGPGEIALVVEVADSSLTRDRTLKLRSYARAGLAEYWIVNIGEQLVEVYTQPESPRRGRPRYRTMRPYAPGQQIPLVIAGTTFGSVPVASLFS
jgi:Uma2 family endonuclease